MTTDLARVTDDVQHAHQHDRGDDGQSDGTADSDEDRAVPA